MAAHPDAVSPYEQTCRSPEFLALEQSCETLITGIKMDPNLVCIALVSERLIPPIVREYCSSSAKLDSEKGQKLFETMVNHVKTKPAVYHTIVEKLEASCDWLKNCLVILRRNYEAEKAKAKPPKETKKATVQKAEVHGVQNKTFEELDLTIEIKGELYALDEIPAVNSTIVIYERNRLLGCQSNLKSLVNGVPGFIGLLNNAIIAIGPRFTQEQRNTHRLMHDIVSLYDKSALTAAKFKTYCSTCYSIFTSVVKLLPSTYNFEKTVLEQTRHLLQLVREMRQSAHQTMDEFSEKSARCGEQIEKFLQCQSYCQTEECVVEAIHIAMAVLKNLSVIMMEGELFWSQMEDYFRSLKDNDISSILESAYRYSEEKRLKIWISKGFKRRVITYHASWVAIQNVCNDHIDVIEQERKDLQHSIDENPSTKESHYNLEELEEKMFGDVTYRTKVQEEIKALREN